MTHDHLRLLLPKYAAGVLTMADAESIRGHLASGCGECLDALYRMPVGMPRDDRPVPYTRTGNGKGPLPGERLPAPAGPASGASSPWVLRALGYAMTAALIAWAIAIWSARPA